MALVPSGRSRFTDSGRPQGLNKVQGIAKPILIEFLKVDRIRERLIEFATQTFLLSINLSILDIAGNAPE
jgi:hypothetical protein